MLLYGMFAINSIKGGSLIEYGILAGLISLVSISSVSLLGQKAANAFSSAENRVASSYLPVGHGGLSEDETATEVATWQIRSGFSRTERTGGWANAWGYHGAAAAPIGSKDAWSGLLEMSRFDSILFDDTSISPKVYLSFSGAKLHLLTSTMSVSCTNGLSLLFSDANAPYEYNGSNGLNTTIIWEDVPNPFVENQSYECSLRDE